MDLIKELSAKIVAFTDYEQKRSLDMVLHHIQIAESHLERGRNGDDHLFNDAIYRTNQAYEGSLKVAYEIFTDRKSSERTLFEMENFFEQSSVLRPRVLELFRNYRKQWRNPSTHDYTLIFAGQEALLAIVSTAAFLSILLDEMLQRRAFVRTAEVTSQQIVKLPDRYAELPLLDQITQLLRESALNFSTAYQGVYSNERQMILNSEVEAFLSTIDRSIKVGREPIADANGTILRPDLVLRRGAEAIVLELKVERALPRPKQREFGIQQTARYLEAASIDGGILFVAPWAGEEVRVNETIINGRTIRTIYGYTGAKVSLRG